MRKEDETVLWFTFEFLSLIKFFQSSQINKKWEVSCDLLSIPTHRESLIKFFQFRQQYPVPHCRCDLLSNFYLWLSSFNERSSRLVLAAVVIYFRSRHIGNLWLSSFNFSACAFKHKHVVIYFRSRHIGNLWLSSFNGTPWTQRGVVVVIYFRISIFD